ncbi:MAG: hypothetical protein RL148_2407 [Planctomycetota bacterium]
MNSNVVRAVFRRDLGSWFGNPTGYVFIVLFVVLAAAALVFWPTFFQQNLANLDSLNTWYPVLLLLFVPAITMGMWATERSYGTQELLFTLPAKDSDLLLGKYLAAAGVYTASLLFTLTLPIGLSFLGSPDWGQVLCNYLGFWLLGLMLLSVAMLGSQLTESLTVSFILGALLSAAVLYFGHLLQLVLPGAGMTWRFSGPLGQFEEFTRGVVSPAGLLLFAGLTVAFLYLNLALLSRRHWRAGDAKGFHGTVRFVSLAVGVVALTAFAVYRLPRLDGTVERIHSLSPETASLLEGLDAKRPVRITAYVSDEVPQTLVQPKRTLLNLLDQFDSLGGSAVEKRIVVAEPYSQDARDAEKNFGIFPRVLSVGEGAGYDDGVFLGFAVQCGIEEVVVPFVEAGMSVEYELMRSIRVAANAERRKIGVLKTEVEMFGGFDFQTMQQKQRWQIVEELQLQYKVENVDPDQDYPAGLDALVVAQPSSLGQEQLDRLAKWVDAGNPTLLVEDPEPLAAPGTAATDPKGGQRNPMMGMQGGGGEKGDISSFLAKYGLSLKTDEVVWDLSFRTFRLLPIPLPEYLFVGQAGMDRQDDTVSGLQRLVFLLSGSFRPLEREGLTFTPLVRSVRMSPRDANGTIKKLDIFQFNPFAPGNKGDWNMNRIHRPSRDADSFTLAARVAGKPAAEGQKGVNLVAIADLDMLSNSFFQLRRQASEDNLRFDNVTFVLNCIDQLTGDSSLIELRKRRPMLRSLDTVLAAQEQFETRWLDQRDAAEQAATEALDKAKARLDEAVKKIQDNTEMDEQAKEIQIDSVRNKEQRRLELDQAQIEDDKRKKIEIAKHEKNVAQRRVQNGYQVSTVLFAPIPALLMGLWVFTRKRSRESMIVPQGRRVAGGVK